MATCPLVSTSLLSPRTLNPEPTYSHFGFCKPKRKREKKKLLIHPQHCGLKYSLIGTSLANQMFVSMACFTGALLKPSFWQKANILCEALLCPRFDTCQEVYCAPSLLVGHNNSKQLFSGQVGSRPSFWQNPNILYEALFWPRIDISQEVHYLPSLLVGHKHSKQFTVFNGEVGSRMQPT